MAKALATTSCAPGLCLKVTRGWLGIPAHYYDAATAWANAVHKHPGDRTPPPGAPVFYAGGKHGHIALALGSDQIRTTDAPSAGRVSTQSLAWPEEHWGLTYLGWTEDLNTQTLPYLEDDVALTDADIDKIAARVEQRIFDHKIDSEATGKPMAFETMTQKTHRNVKLVLAQGDPAAADMTSDQIAKAVADEFADRLSG